MPRLSLYRPEKTKDYKFFDRTIYEMFQIGGVDVFVHKYLGTDDGTGAPKDVTQIQDLLFLENRDRKYVQDITTIRGHYQVQDIDFNLSQFGLFLSNDTIFMTIHINNSVDLLGRKIMPGDVIELPNLIDPHAANNYTTSLKRFYVVEEVNRAAEGFSATWFPHLYRVKLKSIVDSQEYRDILNKPMNEDTYAGEWDEATTYYVGSTVKYGGVLYDVTAEATGFPPPNTSYYSVSTADTLRDLMSTYSKEIAINDAIVLEAELDAPKSGYDISTYFTATVSPETGNVVLNPASGEMAVPAREGYTGYLLGDGVPPNGQLGSLTAQFGFGIQFPLNPVIDDMFLRTDFLPNRTFRYDGVRWIKQEDNVRMTMSNSDDTRQTQKTSFINNTAKSGITMIASDSIRVTVGGDPVFTAGDFTTAFTLAADSAYILTTVNYNSKYLVEVWLNEDSKATNITLANDGGKLGFTINNVIREDTVLRYSVFDKVITQRQSLSKALRPQADN
jgi:hypothetical protein